MTFGLATVAVLGAFLTSKNLQVTREALQQTQDRDYRQHALAVLPCEVGDAAGGWLALERGVAAVVIVGVQPGGEGVAPFLL
ncbi:hypothetical protein GCM10010346_51280 [Streptomyces chryseus]|uniref:Uncharacterized protein n=1 Tax=Streptomyces chryseus TaxID=68186 RepID=A0ABQ3E6T8_9ACTN|nr:hypothetical protein GCM10010346_51280 [Streptomyces chryseus]